MKPSRIKFRKISDPVISILQQLGFRGSFTNRNNAAGAIVPGLPDRGQAVLNDHAVRQIHPEPTSGFQVHGSFVGISAVIIDNILPIEPLAEAKGIKEEVNVGPNGGTR